MIVLDKTKPILVTGANGFVASWLVKKLLEEGHTVHAAVRNPEDLKKVGHLSQMAENSPGKLVFFKTDLLQENSYDDAMKNCELVYHTASPFLLDVKNPTKELIEPAVLGTQNILESANKSESVKRVVLTSSCAAIYTDAIDCVRGKNGVLTEEDWNTTASLDYQPYCYSKTLAEQKAWEIVGKQNNWSLVSMNPPAVFGPPLNPNETTSESIKMLQLLGGGKMRFGVPKMGIGVVDVRDLAEAHYLAGFRENAKGRYIVSAHNSDFLEMSKTLMPRYRQSLPLPKNGVPKWLLLALGTLVNPLFSRKFIRNNVNHAWKGENSKVKQDLGLSFRSLRETMEDSMEAMISAGLIREKK